MTAHSPTPWRAVSPRKFAGVKWDNIIRSERRNDPVCSVFNAGYMEREASANAAFIVKAVNSHDAMAKALMQIEQISDNCVNAEHYTAADALNHLQGIRNIIKKLSIEGTP